jgi:hypothetical protein
MKILILFLMALVMVPTFAMGESPPAVGNALQFEGLTLDTLAVSFTQDAAFVLYDSQSIGCSFYSQSFEDNFKMISQSADNIKTVKRFTGITSAFVNQYAKASPDKYLSFDEPDIVLRL